MKQKVVYICTKCGANSPKWLGNCANCGSWNSFEEKFLKAQNTATSKGPKKVTSVKLSEVVSSNSDRITTSINEFNRVMGGGIVRDSVSIMAAKPGAGKSTLLLQVADDIAHKGYKVLYASGEESESQIKNRADRILKKINSNVWVISDTSMDNIISTIEDIDADFIIIDSIQTVTLDAFPASRAGSPTQTMECANELVRIAKNSERPRAVIMVGQMTKEDELAGLRALEHLVDAVLIIEGESGDELRELLSTKNRFANTGEMGFFTMTEEGMLSLDNPSEFFMTKRDGGEIVSGSTLSVVKEGSRPIIVEIESLVSKSFTPYPSRIGECLGKDQLNTLISILEQRGRIPLYNKNVVLKTTGGIKLKEQGVNLAVIMSIISSISNIAIDNDTVFIADVGLTGELKKVPSLESRVKELDRLGFKRVYVAKNALKGGFGSIEVVGLKNLQEVIAHALGTVDYEE